MDRSKVMRQACFDELLKIAGELQGMVRSGRRPISVDNYLDRETKNPARVADVVAETVKTSGKADMSAKTMAALGVGSAVGGAGLYHTARTANEDRKLGRQVRIQQRGY